MILSLARPLCLGIITLAVDGCATSPSGHGGYTSGFLSDYAQLRPGKGDQAKLVYLAAAADFGKYSKILIDPVQLWTVAGGRSELDRLSRQDQQLVVDYLYTALADSLDKDYLIVKESGPDVLRIRAAVTQGRDSKPVAGLVSTAIPFGLGISYGKPTGFSHGSVAGSLTVEGEFLDGATGQRIAAAVDRRACDFGRLGDIKCAFDYWARRVQMRLAELRAHRP